MRDTMDQLDEFWSKRKSEPEIESDPEAEASAQRRLQDVKGRADAESKKYGFIRSLKTKVFGKKGTEPVERSPRSEEERRQAVIDRAKRS